jgi:hypothetical protein
MIETALSGLLWAQEHLPESAYVDAVWAARYPEFANGNEPKSKGVWPFNRLQPTNVLAHAEWRKATNVTAFNRKKPGQERIAGAVAQIAELVRQQAKLH